jgi:hypothetical protein
VSHNDHGVVFGSATIGFLRYVSRNVST